MAGAALLRSGSRRLTGPFILLALTLSTLNAGPAFAADQGSWQACSGVIGIHNFEPAARGGLCMASRTRDSDYNGERYANLNAHPMNDQVEKFKNTFTTIRLQSFRNANYTNTGFTTGTSCAPGGATYGPYATGQSSGLSSFKSC